MLRIAITIAAFLLAGSAIAQTPSQPPIPSATKTGNKDQQKTSAPNSPAHDYERGTESAPIIVKMLNPPNADAIAKELAKDRFDHAAGDWWNWIFSGLLVLVGIGQGGVLYYTAKVTNKAANAAKKSADVADRALTDLEGPFLYPFIDSDDLEKSFKRFVFYDPQPSDTPVCPSIKFNIKNYGRTAALPQSVSGVFFFGQPEDVHHDARAGFLAELLIGPGDVLTEPIERKMVQSIDATAHTGIMSGHGGRIYLRGSIVFFDIFGNRYEQTFCLTWGPVSKRFMAWDPQRNRRRKSSS